MSRLDKKFESLKEQGKAALVTYVMAFDPNYTDSCTILQGLPAAGADIIELGMPFSDPMADGPTIQKAAIRALKAGSKMDKTLQMVAQFRENNDHTPVILMGYYNPICHYGVDEFVKNASESGVDGLLIVDLPIEEDDELFASTKKVNMALIKLITPTTDEARLKKILEKASGFLYYVAVAGVTGTKSASYDSIESAVARIKKHTNIPVAVGFGIKTATDVAQVGKHADAVVVGSSIVDKVVDGKVLEFVAELSGK